MRRAIERLRELPPYQRFIILLLIPLILIIYVYFMLFSPVLSEVRNLRSNIERTRSDIENIKASLDPAVLENLKKQEKELREEYLRKEEELITTVGLIPTERDVGLVVRNIGRLATKSELMVLSMHLTEAQKARYFIVQKDEGKSIVIEKPMQEPQQQNQQPQQTQKVQAEKEEEGVTLTKRDLLLLVYSRNEAGIKKFLESLRKEGIVSYPLSLDIVSMPIAIGTEQSREALVGKQEDGLRKFMEERLTEKEKEAFRRGDVDVQNIAKKVVNLYLLERGNTFGIVKLSIITREEHTEEGVK
ncbi:MAG: hypothetical protein D6674_02150 [Acidobacteria bacterium]|nr:MAG: hypothetical protein D6674_02150 [Acidobacteriota bacterium]